MRCRSFPWIRAGSPKRGDCSRRRAPLSPHSRERRARPPTLAMGWVTGREAYRGVFWAHSALCRRAPARAREGRADAVAHSPCGEARAGTRSVGWSGAGAHSPRGEARRRHTLWWADRRSCTLPSRGGAAPAHAVVGEPAELHTPLAGRRGAGTRCGWADRRRCTLPSRGGAASAHALDGRTGAGARSPRGEARRRYTLDRRTGGIARSPRGEARRRYTLDRRTGGVARSPRGEARRRHTLWWADRRSCTLPSRGGAAPAHARDRRTGGVARSPCGEAQRRHTLWWADRRSCTLPSRGGAERRYTLSVGGTGHMFVLLTINSLDKACQGSSAREHRLWGGRGG